MSISKQNSSFLEPSGEEKAFVYQQTMELSPLLAEGGGPVAVILKKNKNKKTSKYSVTFILIPETLNIRIKSEGNNLFDVCRDAKEKAKKTIAQIINHTDSPVRNIHIEYFKKFPYLQ